MPETPSFCESSNDITPSFAFFLVSKFIVLLTPMYWWFLVTSFASESDESSNSKEFSKYLTGSFTTRSFNYCI